MIYYHFTSTHTAALLALFASQAFSWLISCRTRILLWTTHSCAFTLLSTRETIKGFTFLKKCHPIRSYWLTSHSNSFQPLPLHQDVPRPYRTSPPFYSTTNGSLECLPSSQKAPSWLMSHISQRPIEWIWTCHSSMGQCYRLP